MTPDERNMIMGLFDRMRSYGAIEKEGEAETLINAQVRQIPDSAYLLVQSVLVQEQTLSSANDRIKQLEARVRDLETAGGRAQSSSGGSFLGGLFGGGRAAATSVPTSRGIATPPGSPWGQSGGQPAAPAMQQPQYQQPQYQQPMQAAPRAGGGFFAQAMTTAAGVAGGMMAADAIRGMMGGGHHQHDTATAPTSYDQATGDAQADELGEQDAAQQAANTDTGSSDSGSWGGSDSSDA